MTIPIALRAPEFWWRKAGTTAALLYPAAAIYGAVAAFRLSQKGYRAKVPVLCIGNPTLGGAGKTPAAIAIGAYLKSIGRKPCFLTRGYGGELVGPILVDLEKHNARMIGDEAPLLAAVAPTVVAQDRAAGAKLAEASGADIIVMDDGFQNSSLEKSFSLLVADGVKGFGNGLPFPAGPLRAPLSPQLRRAQAILIVGGGDAGEKAKSVSVKAGLAVLHGRLVPDTASAANVSGQRVLAYAGIGAPEKFFHSLEAAGAIVADRKSFGDHHRYTPEDAASLMEQADKSGLTLVTTEKDLMRMKGDRRLEALIAASYALRVRLAFDDENAAYALIKNSLGI